MRNNKHQNPNTKHQKHSTLNTSCSIHFAFSRHVSQSAGVTQPLALVAYEELSPGAQLVNRLQDLKYRVQAVMEVRKLEETASGVGAMLIFLDLGIKGTDACALISSLKKNEKTRHIPIIAFADDGAEQVQSAAKQAGATQVVSDTAVVTHLSELIEQALQVE